MTKAGRKKWYAVKEGWNGPQIYDSWEETKKSVVRFRGAVFKSFLSRSQAEEWLEDGYEYTENAFRDNRTNTAVVDEKRRPSPHPTTSRTENVAKKERLHGLIFTPTNCPPKAAPNVATDSSAPSAEVDAAAKPTTSDPPIEQNTIKLSPEQEQVLNLVKAGSSVFFTGSAGTGKSVLLREIIRWCIDTRINHAVTASTGIASVNIGGCTLHSWAGIGLGKEPAEKLVIKILGQHKWARQKAREQRKNQGLPPDPMDWESDYEDPSISGTLKRWRQCRILILDEISMVDGKLFDKLEFMGRALRGNSSPFGGIQLVLSGDFCQLPPVPDSENGVEIPATFAFDAKSWNSCVGKPVVLKKVFRQKDQRFVDMLNAMRFGNLNADIIQSFRKLSRPVEYKDGLEPTDLFPTRREVETANSNRLRSIRADPQDYKALDIPGFDVNGNRISREHMDRLLSRLVAPKNIPLKVGAQVMLIKNVAQGLLVNGSLGRVTDFMTTLEASTCGIKIGMPDSISGEWKGMKEAIKKGAADLKPHPEDNIPQELMRSSRKWPVVAFSTRMGLLPMCCVPLSFEVNNADGEVEAKRDQVPLILAWALSVHKSQGQTLERVRVDLTRTFEKGQAYVALSRATNLETLEVRGFDPLKIQVHPRVIEWTRANTDIHIPLGLTPYDEEAAEFWKNV